MKLNLEMEIDDNMTVEDLRRKIRKFIFKINQEQIIIDHHFIIEKKGKKFVHKRLQNKVDNAYGIINETVHVDNDSFSHNHNFEESNLK